MAGGSSSSGALVVRDQGGGPVIYAKFRDGSVQRERRIGPGWLVRVGAPGAKPNGKTLGEWRERRGRPVDGYLTPDAAREALPAVLTRYRAEAATRRANGSEHVTMREAADAWLEWRRHDDPGGEHRAWKHATWKNNVAYAGRMSRELGPDRVISSVTAADLRALLATGLRPERNGRPIKGRSPSRKLRATYSQTLRGIFGHAHRQGWISSDPAADLPAYRARRKRANDPLRRDEYLTPEEVRAVVAALRAIPEGTRRPRAREAEELGAQDAAMVLVMAMAGLRPGEAIALRWENVDAATAAVRVVESRTLGVTDTPKSHAGRTVPMADEVANALAALRAGRGRIRRRDLVFRGRDGSYVDLSAFRDRFIAAQKRAGIAPARQVRQLRNTFGTICASAGVPLRTLQEWLGHESITTTEIYASFMPRHRDAALVSAAFAASAA